MKMLTFVSVALAGFLSVDMVLSATCEQCCVPDVPAYSNCFRDSFTKCLEVKNSECSPGGTFGVSSQNSYWVFGPDQWPTVLIHPFRVNIIKLTLSLEIKTTASSGIIFYAENAPEALNAIKEDFHGAYLEGGFVKFGTHTHVIKDISIAKSNKTVNDGVWHKLQFEKVGDTVTLCVDTDPCVTSTVPNASNGAEANISPWVYFGGVRFTIFSKTQKHMNTTTGFTGCIAKIMVDGMEAGQPGEAVNTF